MDGRELYKFEINSVIYNGRKVWNSFFSSHIFIYIYILLRRKEKIGNFFLRKKLGIINLKKEFKPIYVDEWR